MINVLERKNLDDFDEFSLLKFSRLCSLLVLLESPDILHSGPQYGALVLSDILGQPIVSDIIYSIIKWRCDTLRVMVVFVKMKNYKIITSSHIRFAFEFTSTFVASPSFVSIFSFFLKGINVPLFILDHSYPTSRLNHCEWLF